jgi:plastocyanin
MFTLTNCAPRVPLGPAHLIYQEEHTVDIELKNYSFQPNHLVILDSKSRIVTVRLINTSGTKHNFTLIDEKKKPLVTVDLIPKGKTSITIGSFSPGNYTFYCNRFFHRSLGMEGMLMAD